MAEKVKRIALGETEAVTVLFGAPDGTVGWVCTALELGDYECKTKWGDRVQKCDPVQLDGSGKKFFAVWVADCAFPPVALIRCDSESEVEDIFISELPWADVDESDLPPEPTGEGKELEDMQQEWDHYTPTDRKTWAYTECINWCEVALIRAEYV